MSRKKPLGKLIPLPVPFSLGRSDSQFVVLFSEPKSTEHFYLTVEVTATILTGPSLRYQQPNRVQIEFFRVAHFAYGNGSESRDFIEVRDYAADHVTFGSDDDFNAELCRQWFSSGKCPDPLAYEVEDSVRVRKIASDSTSKREFLLIGDDSSMYVIAEDFKWKLLGSC